MFFLKHYVVSFDIWRTEFTLAIIEWMFFIGWLFESGHQIRYLLFPWLLCQLFLATILSTSIVLPIFRRSNVFASLVGCVAIPPTVLLPSMAWYSWVTAIICVDVTNSNSKLFRNAQNPTMTYNHIITMPIIDKTKHRNDETTLAILRESQLLNLSLIVCDFTT